ncbi:MAG TPA: hypothetical protein VNL95_05830 [Dehalococcoidia bacterium]|nr:hypothetical protein [Dehalococcoidia bacterium]
MNYRLLSNFALKVGVVGAAVALAAGAGFAAYRITYTLAHQPQRMPGPPIIEPGSLEHQRLEALRERAREIAVAYNSLPKFVGELGGIRFVAEGEALDIGKCPAPAQEADPGVAIGTPLEIRPSYLPGPPHQVVQLPTFVCAYDRSIVLQSGREYYFDQGDVTIIRGLNAALHAMAPREYMEATAIDGRPAVLVRSPDVVDPATGKSYRFLPQQVLVREAFGITIVRGNLSIDQLIKIAEGLNR